jgi:hypothetical protein
MQIVKNVTIEVKAHRRTKLLTQALWDMHRIKNQNQEVNVNFVLRSDWHKKLIDGDKRMLQTLKICLKFWFYILGWISRKVHHYFSWISIIQLLSPRFFDWIQDCFN